MARHDGDVFMGLADDLKAQVKTIFHDKWVTRDGQSVPSSENLKLTNDAVKLDATVLYADLSESTKLVETKKNWFAAEIYKAYLHCAAKIISAEGGQITAYDGDRIMAIFIDGSKNTNASRAGFKINFAVREIINPAIKNQYPKANYQIKQSVGIDTSDLFIARTGIRGSNDLVWVGRAANYAAKLAALSADYPTRITADVYNMLNKSMKTSSDGRSMWQKASWNDMNNITIYRSNWWWSVG